MKTKCLPQGDVEATNPPFPSLHKHEKDLLISVHVTTDDPIPHGFGVRLQIPKEKIFLK